MFKGKIRNWLADPLGPWPLVSPFDPGNIIASHRVYVGSSIPKLDKALRKHLAPALANCERSLSIVREDQGKLIEGTLEKVSSVGFKKLLRIPVRLDETEDEMTRARLYSALHESTDRHLLIELPSDKASREANADYIAKFVETIVATWRDAMFVGEGVETGKQAVIDCKPKPDGECRIMALNMDDLPERLQLWIVLLSAQGRSLGIRSLFHFQDIHSCSKEHRKGVTGNSNHESCILARDEEEHDRLVAFLIEQAPSEPVRNYWSPRKSRAPRQFIVNKPLRFEGGVNSVLQLRANEVDTLKWNRVDLDL